jgi:hypothetical protein
MDGIQSRLSLHIQGRGMKSIAHFHKRETMTRVEIVIATLTYQRCYVCRVTYMYIYR